MICECYRAEKNFFGKVGLCWGTQERDACSCGGDKSKCDFYPSVREEGKKPITNADCIRAMTDAELAEWLTNFSSSNVKPYATARVKMYRGSLLDWLKQKANVNE